MTALGRLTAGVFPVDFGVQVAPGRNDCNLSGGHATMIDALIRLLGPDNVLTAKEDLIPYGFDGTAALKQLPRAVVFPRTAAEIAAILKLAREHRTPVVTRGSGTGLSGGSVPVAGALVMCVLKLDRILEVDEKNLTMLVEPGVVTQRIFDTADAGVLTSMGAVRMDDLRGTLNVGGTPTVCTATFAATAGTVDVSCESGCTFTATRPAP